jgi:hypothetical protein
METKKDDSPTLACTCGEAPRFRLGVQFDAYVHTKEDAAQITRMIASLATLLKASGTHVHAESTLYTKAGDDGREPSDEQPNAPEPKPAPNPNLN